VPGFQNELRPRRSDQVAGVRDIAVGGQFTCALQANQTVVCWGNNQSGQLGDDGNVDISVLPVQVVEGSNSALSGISK
jgi:alpha-tubulin suppressor-like RCC1 family protein